MNARLLGTAVLTCTLLAACTGSNGSHRTGSPPTGHPTSPAAQTTTGPFRLPGKYAYQRAGITASVKYGEESSTLTITNRSGATVSAPGIYLLRAENGTRIDGTVLGSKPVPDGSSERFTVRFDPPVPQSDIGLLALLIGDADFGAFQPPA